MDCWKNVRVSGACQEALESEDMNRASKHRITGRMKEIYQAAELGREIAFRNGAEARLYRECYVRTHTGVIDVKEDRKQLKLGT